MDIAPFTFEMTLSSLAYMELNYPLWIFDFSLLQPYPAEESYLYNLIRPFSLTVLKMLVTIFIAVLTNLIAKGLDTVHRFNIGFHRIDECIHNFQRSL